MAVNLIVPKQSVPPLSDQPVQQGLEQAPPLFSKPWYLWLSNMGDQLAALIIQVANIIIAVGGTSYLFEVPVLTTATTTLITSPVAVPVANDRLRVIITQPSQGDALISWDTGPDFKLVTADDIDTRPNKVSVYVFVCLADGNWWLESLLLGREA